MIIDEKTSRTIMVANLLAIIMIVAIHYSTHNHAVANGKALGWNYLTQEFLTGGLARSAVPYFALISGFFLFSQFSEHRSYRKLLRSRFYTLMLPYIWAATIIFLSIALAKLLKGDTSFFNFKTVFYGILIRPLSGQFWFLRDLCLLVVISPLLLPKSQLLQLTLGLSLFLLWLLELQIAPTLGDWYIINIETLFFFYLGGQLSYRSEILHCIVNSSAKLIAVTSVLLLVVLITRIYMDPTIELWYVDVKRYTFLSLLLYKTTIVCGIICLIQISSLFHNNTRLIYLSGLSFFAFLFHFAPLNFLIIRLSDVIVAKEFGFYLSLPAATVTVFAIAHLMATNLPRLYGMLCGGRNPSKALNRTRRRHAD
jgi:hypothetical protein